MADFVIGFMIVILSVAAVYGLRKKRGSGCCTGCTGSGCSCGCDGSSAKRREKTKEKS